MRALLDDGNWHNVHILAADVEGVIKPAKAYRRYSRDIVDKDSIDPDHAVRVGTYYYVCEALSAMGAEFRGKRLQRECRLGTTPLGRRKTSLYETLAGVMADGEWHSLADLTQVLEAVIDRSRAIQYALITTAKNKRDYVRAKYTDDELKQRGLRWLAASTMHHMSTEARGAKHYREYRLIQK